MTITDSFRPVFTRSIYLAAVNFALAHMFQTLAMSLISQGYLAVSLTAIYVLLPSAILEAVVFFGVGWLAAFAPAYGLSRLLDRSDRHLLVVFLLVGLALGLASLPICAGVAFLALRSSDAPAYPARCVEFAYPMAMAGVIGGYAFWRFTRGAARHRQNIADQFS